MIAYPNLEAFEAWLDAPENQQRHFEWIDGRIKEKMVSHPKSAKLALRLARYLATFVDDHHLGEMTGADGGYHVGSERYIPDAAFASHEKWQAPIERGYLTLAPDLAIEVLSPTDSASEITLKVLNYLQAGTTVWLVEPDNKSITVYVPQQKPKTYHHTDTLLGTGLLDGFTLDLNLVFTES
jgi:Uma2 family endonuclease